MGTVANPFTPHQPIHPDYFAGRIDEVLKINTALNQTRHGRTQHVLLAGERGIGKTSLALYARYLAKEPRQILGTDFNFATAYYAAERNQTLTDVCRGLTAKLFDDVDRGVAQRCLQKLKTLGLHFSLQVPGAGEFEVSKPQEGQSEEFLQADFVKAVEEFWDECGKTHQGILLIIDELNNLKSFAGVGSFFKVVSEAWAVDGYRQIIFMVIGPPPISTKISEDDRSAPRIFTYVELSRMTEEESLSILNKCISGTGKRFDNEWKGLSQPDQEGSPISFTNLDMTPSNSTPIV